MPGANPTIAQIFAQQGNCLDYVNERDKHGNANAANVYDLYDVLVNDRDGEYTPRAVAVFDADRRAAGALLERGRLQRIFDLHSIEALRKYGLDLRGTYAERYYRLIEKLSSSGEKFKSRNFTFGSPTFPSGTTGNGVINRCTVDRFGNTLECTGSEAKTAKVVRDQTNGGRKHREVFLFEGASQARDELLWAGSGGLGEQAAADCLSAGKLRNPSFESSNATADNVAPSSTTAVTSWVLSAAASFKMRSLASLVYRGFDGQGSTTLYSLEFTATGTATQTLLSASPGTVLSGDAPWYLQIAWQRTASATGTLRLTLGSIQTTVSIASGTNGAWNILRMPIGQNSWYRQFGGAQDLTVAIGAESLAVGTVVVDDVVLAPMANMDGTYYLPVGGNTPWLEDDKASWTDTENASRAQHSYWLWRSFGGARALQELRGVWIPTTTVASSITLPD